MSKRRKKRNNSNQSKLSSGEENEAQLEHDKGAGEKTRRKDKTDNIKKRPVTGDLFSDDSRSEKPKNSSVSGEAVVLDKSKTSSEEREKKELSSSNGKKKRKAPFTREEIRIMKKRAREQKKLEKKREKERTKNRTVKSERSKSSSSPVSPKKQKVKFPKTISFHVTTNYSNKIFSKTYSRKKFRFFLSIAGFFLITVLAMFIYSLTLYAQLAELNYLRRQTAKLEDELKGFPELETELSETQKMLKQINIMLGLEKSPDTLDYSEYIFTIKPYQTETPLDTLDSLTSDSLRDNIGQSGMEGYYPQVPPTVDFRITRKYSKDHPGIDFAASEKQAVFATADGVVREIGVDSIFGNYLKIKHGPYFETFYGHLYSVTVEQGDSVKTKDVIGFVGNTGVSTAPHLHFEVRHKGTPIDPGNFFEFKREQGGGIYEQ